MAKQVAGPLIQLLRRDYVHAQDIAVVLEFLRRRLGEEGIPFAVIGALALRQYGFVRATEDIDILTTPEGLEKVPEKVPNRKKAPDTFRPGERACGLFRQVDLFWPALVQWLAGRRMLDGLGGMR